MKQNLLNFGIFILLVSFAVSCQKDAVTYQNKANVEFRLMDGPCDYDNLWVDVQEIQIHSDSNGWESIEPFNAGVYDILELTNGLDTLLCQAQLPAGVVSQIRLVLGANNSLVYDGVTYDLKVPSGMQSGIKLNLHKELLANVSYTVWLDFDACKSVVLTGRGEYILKPVIRVFSDSTNGKLNGVVLPTSVDAIVNVIENSDTIATAIPNDDGYFMVCGLDGTYDVYIDAIDTAYNDTTLTNITVNFGEIVTLDTINLN